MSRLAALACGLVALCVAPLAAAVITCSVNVTAISLVYDPTSSVQNVTTGRWDISCNRAGGDPTTLAWQLGVNDGTNFSGTSNRVQRVGSQRYDYETYRLAPYTAGNLWDDAVSRFSGTLIFANTNATASGTFDIVMPALQTARPAGIYTDTLTVRLRDGTGVTTLATTTFGLVGRTDNQCQISVSPGNVNFTYTSFQAGVANASTSFGIRCTTSLPYTMALDATTGTILGITYNLSLSSASSSGTGATQTHNVNGTITGGQAGSCATATCNGSQTRTLTVTW